MVLWSVAFAVLVVLAVFDSPAMDYRTVVLGALLPAIELVAGHPYVLHTLLGSVVALVGVVLVTRGRRLAARRLVGVPIGLFLHLVADGSWTRAELFWWPFLGFGALGDGQVPERAHLGLSLVLEVAGLVAIAWIIRTYGLTDRAARDRFVRSGRLARPNGAS
jgi:hypothetical protein